MKAKNQLPPLTPLTSPWMHKVMQSPTTIYQLMEEYGSPLNIHHTAPFFDNYTEYKTVFESYDLKHLVLFARKANKCQGFVEATKSSGMGVDTASYQELKQCIELGIQPEKLVVTAAIKSRKLIELAVKNSIVIILDNNDECELVQSVAEQLNMDAKVGVRVSGFSFKGSKLYSRFGFDIEGVADLVLNHFGKAKSLNRLVYCGIHFHLNGYSIDQRGEALHQSLDLALRLGLSGYKTHFIDMGGGLLMNYLKEESQWTHFIQTLQLAVQGKHREITFQNQGLGFSMIEEKLQGELNTYPYFNDKAKAVFLNGILSYSNRAGQSCADRIKAQGIEIRMEPGRSLLDQTGMTIAKVIFRKKDALGNWLVGLEMNMTQMHSSSADFLLDPFILNQNQKDNEEATEVFFTGAYCLERDILLKRKIALNQLPAIGDLVVFVNTAGYMMHFFETEAHLFDLAKNLFFKPNNETIELSDFQID